MPPTEQLLGVSIVSWITSAASALYRVSVRHIQNFVIGFLQIPPRDGHPCLDGQFRLLRPVEDFHLLSAHHVWHTNELFLQEQFPEHKGMLCLTGTVLRKSCHLGRVVFLHVIRNYF